MLKLTTRPARTAPATLRRRGLASWLVLACAVLAVGAWAAPAGRAQSGRRQPAPVSPAPTPTPQPAAREGDGESESVPRGATKKAEGVVVTFAVIEEDGTFFSADGLARGDITEAFLNRLGQSNAVAVSPAGRGSRKEARDRAKAERDTFVVLFRLEEDGFNSAGTMGRTDPRTLVIRTYVFAPQTGDLKYSDSTHQRPYRETSTIGGVRIPMPGGRRVERYPSELQLLQAARDAADRLMSRFNVILPRDR